MSNVRLRYPLSSTRPFGVALLLFAEQEPHASTKRKNALWGVFMLIIILIVLPVFQGEVPLFYKEYVYLLRNFEYHYKKILLR